MTQLLLFAFAGLVFVAAGNKAVIKGKQYVRHTTTARLIGGPVPDEILNFLSLNASKPIVSPAPLPPFGGIPVLITEDVKTVVTRMSIPLNSNTHDNERYMEMLKKFLVNNKIDLNEKLDLVGGSRVPGIPEIENRLQQTLLFMDNLQTILREILVQNGARMPKGSHAPLSHIFRLLQLRRIPVIDLIDLAEELSIENAQDQWITIFIGMEDLIPPYMRSCVTYLLEGLQTRNIIMTDLQSASSKENIFLRGLDLKKISKINFPKQLKQQVPEIHEEELGETTAALLTTVRENSQLTPKLFQHFIKILPRNTIMSDEEFQIFSRMDKRLATEEEKKVVNKAGRKAFEQFNRPPSEIFQTILIHITEADFEGVEDYKTISRLFQLPKENYIVS